MAMQSISNEKQFQSEVLDSEVPVVVDFYGEWCSPCKAIMPMFEELSLEKNFKVVKVDVDEPNLVSVIQRHRIMAVPAIFIYNNGEIIDRIIGNTVDRVSILNKIPIQ